MLLSRLLPTPLTQSEIALINCGLARESERLGDRSRATSLLADFWDGTVGRPATAFLCDPAAAEVLMRVGCLSATAHAENLERAKDLISESARLFEDCHLSHKQAEAQMELAWCYWREGAYKEAQDMLEDALPGLDEADGDTKAVAVLRLAIIEITRGDLEAAERRLLRGHSLFQKSGNDILKGRFHNELGLIYFHYVADRKRLEFASCALKELFEAVFHFRHGGSKQDLALSLNNAGLTYYQLGRHDEADKWLTLALDEYAGGQDVSTQAIIWETRARVLLAQGLLEAAESAITRSTMLLDSGIHCSLLAESLITQGIIMNRRGKVIEAKCSLERAVEVAEFIGDTVTANRATETYAKEFSGNVVDFSSVRSRRHCVFSMRMPDESLRDTGIYKGDAITFVQTAEYADGDLVVALTPAGKFIKFIHRLSDGTARLDGAHPNCRPRYFLPNEFMVLGVAIKHRCVESHLSA